MKLRQVTALAGALAVLSTAACNDFLSGPGIDKDPNNVTELSDPGPPLITLAAVQSTQFEGHPSRVAAMYTQQLSGVARQYQGYDIYGQQPTDVDPYWQGVYIGGGLKDARLVQRLALARDDSVTAGIGKVWEAFIIGMAASFWGDIPYRETLQGTEESPLVKAKFDPQQQVYADVQAQLDTAIEFLASEGNGPGGSDIILGGDPEAWTEVAWTLKARFYLHLAERDPTNYQRAFNAAQNGISTSAHDFNFFHAGPAAQNNVHYQFYFNRGDVLPGAAIINLMKSRISSGKDIDSDRLQFYFYNVCYDNPVSSVVVDLNKFAGYRPAADPNLPGSGGTPAGTRCGTANAAGGFSDLYYVSSVPEFQQPMITYVENLLILAETAFRSGGQAAAQPYLDEARANEVYGAIGGNPVEFRAQPSVPATLQNIMEEKYIDLFLNPEVWNDYKRTCLPALAPAPQNIAATESNLFPEIAGRFPYGLSSFSTNQSNVPDVGATARNWNDPNACPKLTYSGGAY
jgi:hypothetical protein